MKRLLACVAILLGVFAAIFLGTAGTVRSSTLSTSTSPSTLRTAAVENTSLNSPVRQVAGIHVLTLPFTDPRITVSQGWVYDWGSEHRGIDYMLGDRNTTNWLPFDVVAAYDGWACGNCTARQGNAIWIKHVVNGQTFYTYYGHLASFEPNIPVGNQADTVWVQRGQKIGVSGNSGSDVTHLHFQVSLSAGPIDPYDLWTMRSAYSPGCSACQMGPLNFWTSNPPSFASGEPGPTPPPPPPPPPASTPVPPTSTPTRVPPTNTPVPTATKVICTVNYGLSVGGVLNSSASETRYCLSGAPGEWVSIRMFAAKDSGLDTYVKLYSPEGVLIGSDDDGAQVDSNSFLVAQLPVRGTYQIVATRFGDANGAYSLRVDKGARSGLGDLNADCAVNQADFQLMSTALANPATNAGADLNLDGAVNVQDQTIQQYRLGRGCMQLAR